MRAILFILVAAALSGCLSNEGQPTNTALDGEAQTPDDVVAPSADDGQSGAPTSEPSDSGEPSQPAAPTDAECTGADQDGDGTPDACDNDIDGDGVPNTNDICAGHDDTVDGDSDGIPDGCDDNLEDGPTGDLDGDTVPNNVDECPGEDDTIDAEGDHDLLPDCRYSTTFISQEPCLRIQQDILSQRTRAVTSGTPTAPQPGEFCVQQSYTPWTPYLL